MVKFSDDYISRFHEKTTCKGCGKQMTRGERVSRFVDDVCIKCANDGYEDSRSETRKRKR